MKSPALLILIICLLALTMPAMAGSPSVERSISTPVPGSEFTVTLVIDGIQTGGIVETLPEGFNFAGTACPEGSWSLKGDTLAFAVTNMTEITYQLRAPEGALSGRITGVWEDFLNETTGTVSATEAGTTAPAEGTPEPTASGCMALLPFLALGLLCILMRGGRT